MSLSLVVKGGNITGNHCCCLAAASVVDLILAPNATACDLKYGSVAAQGYQDGGAVTAFSITNATATQTVAVAHASLAATGGLKVTDPPPAGRRRGPLGLHGGRGHGVRGGQRARDRRVPDVQPHLPGLIRHCQGRRPAGLPARLARGELQQPDLRPSATCLRAKTLSAVACTIVNKSFRNSTNGYGDDT